MCSLKQMRSGQQGSCKLTSSLSTHTWAAADADSSDITRGSSLDFAHLLLEPQEAVFSFFHYQWCSPIKSFEYECNPLRQIDSSFKSERQRQRPHHMRSGVWNALMWVTLIADLAPPSSSSQHLEVIQQEPEELWKRAVQPCVRPSIHLSIGPSLRAVSCSVAPGGAAAAEHVLGSSTGQKGRFPPAHRLWTWSSERAAPTQEVSV